MADYLQQLTGAMLEGVIELPEQLRESTAEFVLRNQRDDGGFAGREGASDLYYTGFALRSLAILGKCTGDVADRSAAFLRGRMSGRESVVDLYSLVYAAQLLQFFADIDVFQTASGDWRGAMSDMMSQLRRDDGGYAKGAEGQASSTYHTFLIMLCLQAIDSEIPDPAGIISFLRSQHTDEGGFREIRVSKRAGTNPTAAAIAGLEILGALDDNTKLDAIDFFLDMQTDEGGFRANTRIPIADVLSTFTSLVSLRSLGALDHQDLTRPAVTKFVSGLAQNNGGFFAAAWDEVADVEYTFYGLGALAVLAASDVQ